MPDTFVSSMFVALFAVIVFAIAGAISWKWQRKTVRLLEKMDRNRPIDLLRKMTAGGDWWAYPRSSASRAFDEYRTETLRRLEEEQREFRDFLDRLRRAKNRAEFDQFMAERRNRRREIASDRNTAHEGAQPRDDRPPDCAFAVRSVGPGARPFGPSTGSSLAITVTPAADCTKSLSRYGSGVGSVCKLYVDNKHLPALSRLTGETCDSRLRAAMREYISGCRRAADGDPENRRVTRARCSRRTQTSGRVGGPDQ